MEWIAGAADHVYRVFAEPLSQTFFLKSLLGGCLVAVVSGVVGCLVVLRRMAFLGDALSHAMIAGVAGGYLVMKLVFGLEAHAPGMLLGSLLSAVVTVGLIGLVSKVSRVKDDTSIGIMYTGIFALGVVVVSMFRHYIHIDIMHFIMGDVLAISDADLLVSALTAALVLGGILLFFRHFQIAAFDPVMAASIGLPVLLLDYALTVFVSLVVVSAVSMVGVILVVGLLITPAATAYLLCDRLSRMMALAALFGVTGVTGGLYLSLWLDTAGGGAVMLFTTFQFLVILFVAPEYGILARWLRQRRIVPQHVMEDILGTMLRAGTGSAAVPLQTIRRYVHESKRLSFALRNMTREGWLEKREGGWRLTQKGAQEASRVLRAHRLWESYLAHVGTPASEVHAQAHILEHMRDPGAIAYLDALLGHPDADPHGKVIPAATAASEPSAASTPHAPPAPPTPDTP